MIRLTSRFKKLLCLCLSDLINCLLKNDDLLQSFQLLEELGVRLKSSSRKRSHKEEPDGGKDGHDKETKKPRTEVQQRVSGSTDGSCQFLV